MRIRVTVALLSALVGCQAGSAPAAPEGVYLFDCGGRVQAVGDNGVAGAAIRVSEIDPTLPDRVRDGCAVHGGWYDSDADVLVLEVQTVEQEGESDALPTRLLSLSLPALVLGASEAERTVGHDARVDVRAVEAILGSIESPFGRSMGYVSGDGTALLLQELDESAPAGAGPVSLDPLWRAGTVSLRSGANTGATGRYALVDLVTRSQRGGTVRVGSEATAEYRVVCFTPGGRVLLAAARNALLILDVMDASRRTIVADLPLDLHWTACAGS